LIATAVRLAKNTRDEFWNQPANRVGRSKPFIAASVGPYGAFLADGSEYRGNYGISEAELIDFHRPRLEILAAAGAELFAFETMPSLLEARALLRLMREFPRLTAWFSFTARDEARIAEGTEFTECVRVLSDHEQVAAIGINCTAPKFVTPLIRKASGLTAKPLLVYPNSGGTYDASVKEWTSPAGAEAFSESARAWHEAGASLIGGCCQTTPRDIRGIAKWARPRESTVKKPLGSLELAAHVW